MHARSTNSSPTDPLDKKANTLPDGDGFGIEFQIEFDGFGIEFQISL